MKEIGKNNNSKVLKIAFILEKFLAVVVVITICLGIMDIFRLIWFEYITDFKNIVQYQTLNNILGQVLLLVVGVELVIMLSLHIPGAFIEALLYAIARKILLLPRNDGMMDVLLGVIAMAGLFAIKKFLIQKGSYMTEINNIKGKCDDKMLDEINIKYEEEYKN
ncbi:phosphate-starvation-inducible PsiE family protein [Metaclostridioides mangenotii]|uniref:phosphate-starvation-inducible PsiE family protein n=1 Tax=Metaclostridioides mangenotii TaxID=1540 RepID=UPI00068EFB40|nr:phosphate-starvation-inducible PsiE family protein [Clostridioides mangenotii]